MSTWMILRTAPSNRGNPRYATRQFPFSALKEADAAMRDEPAPQTWSASGPLFKAMSALSLLIDLKGSRVVRTNSFALATIFQCISRLYALASRRILADSSLTDGLKRLQRRSDRRWRAPLDVARHIGKIFLPAVKRHP